ncbi:unnamed protein product [Effrenium voratum]|uniref:C2H2-type domain-containing protein n=1 Tax=Effrenium voratum TaxID=2562239 RepID=A0AA36IH72_9DINO|nr:unnamed protein product [Effrenium voratum]
MGQTQPHLEIAHDLFREAEVASLTLRHARRQRTDMDEVAERVASVIQHMALQHAAVAVAADLVATARDKLLILCTTCGQQCQNRAETYVHTLETGHAEFKQTQQVGYFDRTPLRRTCKACGYACANRAESWIHTEETGHTEFSVVRDGCEDRTPNPATCTTCGHSCANRAESWEHTEETGHTGFSLDRTTNPMTCTTCGHVCASRAESREHTEETGHSRFERKDGEREGSEDRTPDPMICKTCGHSCANRAESWEHTEATGHRTFCGIGGISALMESLGSLQQLHLQKLQLHQALHDPVLYHQTSPEAAREILRSQKMRRGSGGLAGGGIYFADSKEATNKKAHKRGVILQASVRLGKVKAVCGTAYNTTFTSLQSEGFDSVKVLDRPTGIEYVVYSWDQVSDIRQA